MKKLIFASIVMLASLTACTNETQNDDFTSKTQTEKPSKISARDIEDEPIEINPEIQAEIDATMNGSNPNGKLICSVGVGSFVGHSCLELWGGIYEYSWVAENQQQLDPDTGTFFYTYSFKKNPKCSCGK